MTGTDFIIVLADAREELIFLILVIALPLLSNSINMKLLLRSIIISSLVPIIYAMITINKSQRIFGTFAQDQANIFGLFLAMICLLIMLNFRIEKSKIWKTVYVFIGLFAIIMIGYTQSRRALFGLLIAIIALFPKLEKKQKRFILIISLIMFSILFYLMLPRIVLIYDSFPTSKAISSIIIGGEFSDYDSIKGYLIERRFLETVKLLKIIKNNLIMGIGLGKIGYYPAQFGVSDIYLHNYYLSLWLRFGVIGLMAYVFLLFCIIRYLSRKIKIINCYERRVIY